MSYMRKKSEHGSASEWNKSREKTEKNERKLKFSENNESKVRKREKNYTLCKQLEV